MIQTKIFGEATNYLLRKLGNSKQMKIIKLMYLADKYHLTRYGRSVTHDIYYAMPKGPVGVFLKSFLDNVTRTSCDEHEDSIFTTFVQKERDKTYKAKNINPDYPFKMLSETDIEALDFVIKHYGDMSPEDLSDYSHKYPEWLKYEDEFSDGKEKGLKIDIEELFSVLENDPLFIEKTHIDCSISILRGEF
jgi:uncharacterized phage-associated protein